MKFLSAVSLLTFLILASDWALAAQLELDFAYSGVAGPERWGLLSPENVACEKGKKQSPVDIPEKEFLVNRLRPQPKFSDATNAIVFHNGHTVEVTSADKKEPLPVEMKINNKKFELEQMHFHTPSEHRVAGKPYDAEAHLVFASEDKKSTAVVAAFFIVSSDTNEFLKPITDEVPQKNSEERPLKSLGFSKLQSMLDDLKEVYSYEGSLTTPPCTEGLQFLISRKIQSIGFKQLLDLRNAMGFNARPVQFRKSLGKSCTSKKSKRRLFRKSRNASSL